MKDKPTPKRIYGPIDPDIGTRSKNGNAKRTTHSRRKKGGRQHRH